jgi:5-epi-alpha-selinene synthase
MKIKLNVKAEALSYNHNQTAAHASQGETGVIESFVLPQLYCPFPSAVNPHAEAAEQHSLRWAQLFGIVTPAACQRLRASNFGALAARTYPAAPREELLIVSDWLVWVFLKDDQELSCRPEELAAIHARFLAILEGDYPTGQDASFIHALADIRQRMRRLVTPSQMRFFVQTVREYLAGVVWESANRNMGTPPDVATFIHQRQYVSGVYPMLAFIELCEQIELPPILRGASVVRRLNRLTNNVISWCNDIFSLEKELRHGEMLNLAIALRAEYGLTLQAAVARAAEMHDAEARAFLELESRLPSFGAQADEMLDRYIAGLRSWMRGNYDWSQMTARYRPLAQVA